MIASNADLSDLRVVAERFRREIAAVRYIEDSLVLGVTLSVGATLARASDTPDSLIKRCDQLLYAAKKSGRNCVRSDDSVAEPKRAEVERPRIDPSELLR